jgi:hypothetical protein
MRSLSLRPVTINRNPGVAIATFRRRWRGLCQVSRSAWLLRTDTNSVRSLQTKLQTDCAAQNGIGHYKPGYRLRNSKQEHTLSYYAARAVMRIIELENRCTDNRTVGSNPATTPFSTTVCRLF